MSGHDECEPYDGTGTLLQDRRHGLRRGSCGLEAVGWSDCRGSRAACLRRAELSNDRDNGCKSVPDEAIFKAVASTGMRAIPWASESEGDSANALRRQQTVFAAASGVCVLIGFVVHIVMAGGFSEAWQLLGGHANHATPWPEVAVYLAAILLGGRFVVVKTWYAARSMRPDMNLLMTVAVIGAIVIGEWFEAATVSFLFALSLAIESWSIGRARRALAALLDLGPQSARLLGPDGSETSVPVSVARPRRT